MVGKFEQVKRGVSLQGGGAPHNGRHSTRDPLPAVFSRGPGGWVMPGVRCLSFFWNEAELRAVWPV